jgi:hypothetical protein
VAAIKATTTIPIIGIDLESDPVANGWVASIGRPGGNLTGLFLDLPELSGKQIEFLKEAVPTLAAPSLDAFKRRPVLRQSKIANTHPAARRRHQDADGFSARARYKIGMHEMRAELIDCHDCRRPVSFRALNCPHCGSTEPTGSYAFSKKEARRFRVEQRNDHMLVVTTVACTGVGALYGILGSSSTLGAILVGIGYGVVGLLIGVPIGFAINLTRRLIR